MGERHFRQFGHAERNCIKIIITNVTSDFDITAPDVVKQNDYERDFLWYEINQ